MKVVAAALAAVTALVLVGVVAEGAGNEPETVAAAQVSVNDSVTTGTNHFTYTGNWVPCGGCRPAGAYQNDFRYAYTTGARYVFSFTGTQVKLFAAKEPAGGVASVSFDGGPPVDVNQYAASAVITNIWSSPQVTLGAHTVAVTVTGRKAGGSSPTITIDRADVITDAPASSSSASPTPSSSVGSSPTESSSVAPSSTEPETTTTQPADTTTSPAPTTDTTTATSTSPAPVGQPVITRNGNQLFRNGQTWKFAGLNADTWFGCWDGELGRTTDANLDRYFGELNPHSLTRIFAYANAPWQATLPRIMAAAARHGQYLMVTLSDDNGNGTQCGSNKGVGYPADGGAVTAHATAVATMTAGHPEVAIFEAINEGDHDLVDRPWYQSIARAVKAADPGALFATGAFTCYGDTAGCWQVEDFPENDLVSIHEYDWNGGAVSHWASNAQAIAAKVGKPWFAGEDGFCCGGGPGGQSESTVANQLQQEWSAYLNAPGCAGMLYWDFKWAYPDVSTINFGDPAWTAASTFRHQWQGP